MGKTFAEKVLGKATGREVSAGEIVVVKPDFCLSHENGAFVKRTFESIGLENPISEGVLRKMAHFGEFAVLALLYIGDLLAFGFVSCSQSLRASALAVFSAVPVCFLMAGIDEFIQRFSAGRAPQFTDMLIDTAGALFAALCFFTVFSVMNNSSAISFRFLSCSILSKTSRSLADNN